MDCMHTNLCCGVAEFQGVNEERFNVITALQEIQDEGDFEGRVKKFNGQFGAILITGAWDKAQPPYGEYRKKRTITNRMTRLAEYILENKLGEWFDITNFTNPVHDTEIAAAMFIPHGPNMAAWSLEHPMPPREEYWNNW